MKKQKAFVTESNYPYKEYLRYLAYKEKDLEMFLLKIDEADVVITAIEKEIISIHKKIRQLSKNANWYLIMDMIFAGECEEAQKLCPPNTFTTCERLMKSDDAEVNAIYGDFANQYGLKRKEMDNVKERN